MIIRGGRNIYPAPIEALALRHPRSSKAAAFPVADPRLGERVCLAVVPTRRTRSSTRTRSSSIWPPPGCRDTTCRNSSCRLAEMPLTASGKIVKRELVRWVAEGRVRPLPVRFGSPAAAEG